MRENAGIILYQSADGKVRVDCRFEDETLWLTQAQIAQLFGRDVSVISRHIKNIFMDGELNPNNNLQNLQIVHSKKPVVLYTLDVILAVGYRVKSPQATLFRQWATAVLHEYLQKGFAMNDEFLKNMGGGVYWKELLERIRDIRASEKVMYRQVLDLYATSLDYNASTPETIEFFKIVQNKLHYAVSGHTASEIVFNRANSELPFMGLTSFKGERPVKSEVTVAKNYMSEKELFALRKKLIPGGERSKFPDLVVHKRGTHEENLLIVEFKLKRNPVSKDINKLQWFTNPQEIYRYQSGMLVLLPSKRLLSIDVFTLAKPCQQMEIRQMNNSWPTVKLGEVCEVVRGGSPRPIMDYVTHKSDGLNWLKIGDVQGVTSVGGRDPGATRCNWL